MDDNIRTHIMDYLEDFCNISADKTEDLAENLDSYLNERGYVILDEHYYQNLLKNYMRRIK